MCSLAQTPTPTGTHSICEAYNSMHNVQTYTYVCITSTNIIRDDIKNIKLDNINPLGYF